MPSVTRDRAVSTVVGFVLILGVASLLVTGLLVATGDFVDNQRQETIRDEMEVLGQQLAADIAASDRMVRAGGTTVRTERPLPERITGVTYQINVTSSGGGLTTIQLSTQDPSVSAEVSVRTTTPVASGTTVNGGDVEIVYDAAANQLEVQNG